MLPVLVLLVASSAFAAPGVLQLNQVSSNNLAYSDNTLVGRAYEAVDDGDVNINELNLGAVLKDLSKQGGNQAFVNGQAVAVLAEVATGRPGDSCVAANYVNAYARYVQSGNPAGVREALAAFIQSLNGKIDNAASLITNKESVRYKSGSRGQCSGEGRTYQFESAWDVILGSVPSSQQGLVAEEYSVAKRLYCGFNAESNNVAATLTAASLPPTIQVFEHANQQLGSFLASVGSKGNVGGASAALKQALSAGVGRCSL